MQLKRYEQAKPAQRNRVKYKVGTFSDKHFVWKIPHFFFKEAKMAGSGY